MTQADAGLTQFWHTLAADQQQWTTADMGGAGHGDDRGRLVGRRSKRYRVQYRTPERHQTDKRGFKTMHEAADFAASAKVAKLQGHYVRPSHGKLLTGPWVVDWSMWARRPVRPVQDRLNNR